MKISIRKFLLINLLVAITITTTLTAIGNYYLDQKDIQHHLDILMATSTLSYQSLLGDDLTHRKIDNIQKSINHIAQDLDKYYRHNLLEKPDEKYEFIFQVWSDNGQLLLRSPSAPKLPLTTDYDGFSDKQIEGKTWRVFTVYNKQAGVRTVVAEPYESRYNLGHRIAQDDLYIMLLTFPLSGLLIWLIISKGLETLNRIAKELSDRAPTYLEPVDLTEVPEEVKPLIDELNKLFLRLQQAFDREKRFAADAAHELRTPLAALKTQAQVALKASEPEEHAIALQNVIAGVNRSTHIIQQLLTMSRLVPEASHLNDLVEVNLYKLTAEIIASLIPQALEKGIEVELENNDSLITVTGNVTAISILIRNLVDNAIRYTPENGKVLVVVSKDESGQITFKVVDNGPGIPAELRARVFERFFRVLGNKSPGSGLGLAIVQQIAKLHSAAVNLSAPTIGTGLIIEVVFPAPNEPNE